MNDKKRLKNIWKRFRTSGMQKDIDEHPEKHTFEFSVDEGVGWEYVDYVVDGKHSGSCRVSYIGPDVDRFIEFVENLSDGKSDEFFWYDEPGEYRWFVSRKGDYVYIEAPRIENGFFLNYDYFVSQLNGQHA